MYNIGKRIKELRKKRDLTQEKLADYLGVTHKSVSKWECGQTVPDLTMIVPLSRILQVTTDVLLSGEEEDRAERLAELNERCDNYWKYDQKEMYQTACQAVSEYPENYRFLVWLAGMERGMAHDSRYIDDPEKTVSEIMIERSLKHSRTVIAECQDSEIRNKAIWNAMFCCKEIGQEEEALRYAQMLPQKTGYTRNTALLCCLQGDRLLEQQQKIIFDGLTALCHSFLETYWFAESATPQVMAALDMEEAILNAAFPDGKYLHFHHHLFFIYEKRADLALKEGNAERAIDCIRIMIGHIREYTVICHTGNLHFSSAALDRVQIRAVEMGSVHSYFTVGSEQVSKPYLVQLREELQADPKYEPLRGR